jgi:hypothetical protein
LLRVQRQQLPTESQVLEDEVLPGTENAYQPTEEMSERHDHGKNCSGKIRIELCAKSFILQVYDVLAKHNPSRTSHRPADLDARNNEPFSNPANRVAKLNTKYAHDEIDAGMAAPHVANKAPITFNQRNV